MFAIFCNTPEKKIAHIEKKVSKELRKAGFPVNNESLYWSYKGLADGWLEDEDTSSEKMLWVLALQTEILRLSLLLTPEQKDPNL
jgi:hypothetical protein